MACSVERDLCPRSWESWMSARPRIDNSVAVDASLLDVDTSSAFNARRRWRSGSGSTMGWAPFGSSDDRICRATEGTMGAEAPQPPFTAHPRVGTCPPIPEPQRLERVAAPGCLLPDAPPGPAIGLEDAWRWPPPVWLPV